MSIFYIPNSTQYLNWKTTLLMSNKQQEMLVKTIGPKVLC